MPARRRNCSWATSTIPDTVALPPIILTLRRLRTTGSSDSRATTTTRSTPFTFSPSYPWLPSKPINVILTWARVSATSCLSEFTVQLLRGYKYTSVMAIYFAFELSSRLGNILALISRAFYTRLELAWDLLPFYNIDAEKTKRRLPGDSLDLLTKVVSSAWKPFIASSRVDQRLSWLNCG